MEKVLIVEDDPDLAKILTTEIADAGFQTTHAGDGREGLELALKEDFAVVLLDYNLPSMTGIEICRVLREKKKHVGILMLTSRTEEIDRVLGLEIGADDYVTKPFSMRELIARVKAILRRSTARAEDATGILNFAELTIDTQKRKVTISGNPIELTAIEFNVLCFLALHPGRPFTRDELMEHVWGYHASCFESTITTHLSRLRSKIEPDTAQPRFIKTVRGHGYRFTEQHELTQP